ncbi:hypothetical protein P43SY_004770 [Pythium insidiosum]|uniref:Uncharacterized protein n=1 Tax=Pythium insidiosum TaxID=114742 RepID=A0AAD5M7F4_PYTIN|nr:hypothetical protein P43SY_004770 [Pythium insidiosum]
MASAEKDPDCSYRVLESGRRKSIARGRLHRLLSAYPRLAFLVIVLVCLGMSNTFGVLALTRTVLHAYDFPRKLRIAQDHVASTQVTLATASTCVRNEALLRFAWLQEELEQLTRQWQRVVHEQELIVAQRGNLLTKCELAMGEYLVGWRRKDPTGHAKCIQKALTPSPTEPTLQESSNDFTARPHTGAATWLAHAVSSATTEELWAARHSGYVSALLLIESLAVDVHKIVDSTMNGIVRALESLKPQAAIWEADSAELQRHVENELSKAEMTIRERVGQFRVELERTVDDGPWAGSLEGIQGPVIGWDNPHSTDESKGTPLLPPLTREFELARAMLLVVEKAKTAAREARNSGFIWRSFDSVVQRLLFGASLVDVGFHVLVALLVLELLHSLSILMPLLANLFTETYTEMAPLDLRDMPVQSMADFWALVRGRHSISSVIYLLLTDVVVLVENALRAYTTK